jgi:hypothetical protein
MVALVLGDFVFQDFEIPGDKDGGFPFGGEQAGHLHKLPGGVRIFDAQGPDDYGLTWSGRFRGANALSRAMQLDSMRRAGGLLQLTALSLSYSVVIRWFKPAILRPWEINYTIYLDVITDNNHGIDNTIPATLDSLVGGDIASGLAILGQVSAAVLAAVNAFSDAVDAIGSLQESGGPQLQPVKIAAFAVLEALNAAQAAEDEDILNSPVASTPIDTGPADILATLTALENEVALLDAGAYFGRAAANVINATG